MSSNKQSRLCSRRAGPGLGLAPGRLWQQDMRRKTLTPPNTLTQAFLAALSTAIMVEKVLAEMS
ncbi:MAG: hypothetical protein AAGH42_05575 [Pseudomonadota bacterium]